MDVEAALAAFYSSKKVYGRPDDPMKQEFRVKMRRAILASRDDVSIDWPLVAKPADILKSMECKFCNGTGWVEDQNWSPDYDDIPQERIPGNGMIRCMGFDCDGDLNER